MKKFVMKLLVLIMMISCLNALNVSAYDHNIIMSAYLDVLNGTRDYGENTVQYLLYDIDKNGIPEIIIDSGTCEADKTFNFYTYDNRTCKWLGEKYGSLSFASIPDDNGILCLFARQGYQHISSISILDNSLKETNIIDKYLTLEDHTENGDYYEPYHFYEGSVYLEFKDKKDMSGFGNFNYITSDNATATLYEYGTKKGIEYYNKGLYYEAIDEIQWFCDANWYNMTEEQQNNALWYLNNAKSKLADRIFESAKNNYNNGQYYEVINEVQRFCDFNWYYMTKDQQDNALWYLRNSKSKLADYLFKSGKNYYNNGLYYEAKDALTNAVYYYTQSNNGNWKTANDYLYNTNNRIKHLESKDPKIHTYNSHNGKCTDCGTQLLYSGKGINIYYLGSKTLYGNLYINLKIDNNSNRAETIQVREESVNNYMTYLFMSTDVLPQKSAFTSISLPSYSSPVALNDIYNIEFRFILCENDFYLTPRISLDF